MTNAPLPPLSNASITAFLACQRRFELRYLNALGWPLLPAGDALAAETAEELGKWFHLAVEQRALGQDVTQLLNQSPKLHGWWLGFLRNRFDKPKGEVWHEARLNFSFGGERILVVMDRLQVIEGRWTIWDWKTGNRFQRRDLEQSWQTRLYRFALAHAGQGFHGGDSVAPESITMTYWSAAHDQVESFAYDAAQYQADERAITAMIAAMHQGRAANFPPTGKPHACQAKGRPCPYVPLCLNDVAVVPADEVWEWPEEDSPDSEETGPFV